MKIQKTASGKKSIKLSYQDWTRIGQKAGWIKTSDIKDSEGWALSDWGEAMEEQDEFPDLEEQKQDEHHMSKKDRQNSQVDRKVEKMKRLYEEAKEKPTGSKIKCPYCEIRHTKSPYQKIFCSNREKKGSKNCKDKFWNMVREPWRYKE